MKSSKRAQKAIHLAGVKTDADDYGALLVEIAACIAKTCT